MDRLVFTANMAMSEYRLDRQNMTHELANVSTPGFKKAYQLANRAIRTEGDGFDTRYLPRAVTSPLIDLALAHGLLPISRWMWRWTTALFLRFRQKTVTLPGPDAETWS